MQVTGVKGVVKVGPHEAASFTSWSLVSSEESKGTYVFTGVTETVDTFWITQSPRDLVVTVGKDRWRWRGVDLVFAGGRITAILPRPEVV